MESNPGTSQASECVNFNGLRVQKNHVPLLIQFLCQCDPMTIPDGEELEPDRRETVARLFRSCFQDGGTQSPVLSALGGDRDALRYLTGLMASRY